MNSTLHYLSNFLETNLKRRRKDKNPQRSRIKNHLIDVCRSNTSVDLTIEGSYLEYKSMFVRVVRIGETVGFLIDSLIPREGNYRLDSGKKVLLNYSYGEMRYKFQTTVLRYVETEFPAYFLALPTAVKSNEKRMFYRMPTTTLRPISLESGKDNIRNALLQHSKVLDFTSDGLCLEFPPVEHLKTGKRFLEETLQQIIIRWSDSTTSQPFNASCCYLRPSPSSNGLLCGIRFEDISVSDKKRLARLYNERQRSVRVA